MTREESSSSAAAARRVLDEISGFAKDRKDFREVLATAVHLLRGQEEELRRIRTAVEILADLALSGRTDAMAAPSPEIPEAPDGSCPGCGGVEKIAAQEDLRTCMSCGARWKALPPEEEGR